MRVVGLYLVRNEIDILGANGRDFRADGVPGRARRGPGAGVDGLLPIDADEFWIGDGQSMRSVLEATPNDVGALRCEVLNFVQRREELAPTPSSLGTAVMRVAEPASPPERCGGLVESGQLG